MLRRTGITFFLALILAGFVPLAWSCAAMAQRSDCCPDHKPCDSATAYDALACCAAQPVPAQLSASVAPSKQVDVDEPQTPLFIATWISARSALLRPPDPSSLSPRPHFGDVQQQTYLRTGRLRL